MIGLVGQAIGTVGGWMLAKEHYSGHEDALVKEVVELRRERDIEKGNVAKLEEVVHEVTGALEHKDELIHELYQEKKAQEITVQCPCSNCDESS